MFVTSDTHRSKYFYARDDKGWHRIHPEHRVWFLSTDDLLRAFPGRVLHPVHSPTPTPTPTE